MNQPVYLFLLLPICISGQLTARFSSAKLPHPSSVTSCYDGKDSVYILGGSGSNGFALKFDEISKFNITNDTIKVVGKLPFIVSNGICSIDSDGNVYFIGGIIPAHSEVKSTIYRFDPLTGKTSWVGYTSAPLAYGQSIYFPETESILIFGTADYSFTTFSVTEYNITNQTSTKITDIPAEMHGGSSAIAYDGSEFVYFFSYNWTSALKLAKYSVKTKETTVEIDTTQSGTFSSGPTAIFDGENIVIVSGSDAVRSYNPVTEETAFYSVGNPYSNGNDWQGSSTSGVYLESLNRIYMFGSFNYKGYVDDIIYLDLNPINNPNPTDTTEPDTTTEIFI